MIKKSIVFIACLMISSWSPWAKQEIGLFFLAMSSYFSEAELGDGYYYLSYYNAIDVGSNEGSMIYKSTQKSYFQTILIKGGIIEVNKDKAYILVGQNKQQLDLKVKTDVYYYWIIEKARTEIYGPLTFDEYIAKKKELGVSESLKLKSEK